MERSNRLLALQAAQTPGLDVAGEVGKLDHRLDEVLTKMSAFRERFAGDEQKTKLDELSGEIAKYKKALTFVSQMMEIDFNSAVSFLAPFDKNSQALIASLDSIVAEGNADSRNRAAEADRSGAQARKTSLIVAVSAVVFLVALTWTIATATVASVKRIAGRTESLADGDTSVDIRALARKDELGAIVRSLEVFRTHQLQVSELRAEQEAAKIRAEERRRADLMALADTFEGSIRTIASMVSSAATEMSSSAKILSDTSKEASREATVVTEASIEATQNVQSVASAAQELSASIREITVQVTNSSHVAAKAVDEAEQTSVSVNALAETANKIGHIVALINDIAGQTNLLALNATIEAARAGDAGKGFAVVANEVKSLANQTARATSEITDQVQEIQRRRAARSRRSAISGERSGPSTTFPRPSPPPSKSKGRRPRKSQGSPSKWHPRPKRVSRRISSVSNAASEAGQASQSVLTASADLAKQAETLDQEVDGFLATIRRR